MPTCRTVNFLLEASPLVWSLAGSFSRSRAIRAGTREATTRESRLFFIWTPSVAETLAPRTCSRDHWKQGEISGGVQRTAVAATSVVCFTLADAEELRRHEATMKPPRSLHKLAKYTHNAISTGGNVNAGFVYPGFVTKQIMCQ